MAQPKILIVDVGRRLVRIREKEAKRLVTVKRVGYRFDVESP